MINSIFNQYYRDESCWLDLYGRPVDLFETVSTEELEYTLEFKSPFLNSLSDIDTLTSINGISIEEIEKRARPCGYSKNGFIGKDESFIEVIKKDWQAVKKLNVTHKELANHLENIIFLVERQKNSSKTFFSIDYSTKDMVDNTVFQQKPVNLKVVLMSTKGKQDDLFTPEDESKRNVKTPDGWNEENTVINLSNNIALKINSGIIAYIREFGFYEGGGEQNPYRVDPVKVMALLTGNPYKSFKKLQKKIGDKF